MSKCSNSELIVQICTEYVLFSGFLTEIFIIYVEFKIYLAKKWIETFNKYFGMFQLNRFHADISPSASSVSEFIDVKEVCNLLC